MAAYSKGLSACPWSLKIGALPARPADFKEDGGGAPCYSEESQILRIHAWRNRMRTLFAAAFAAALALASIATAAQGWERLGSQAVRFPAGPQGRVGGDRRGRRRPAGLSVRADGRGPRRGAR